MPFAGAALLSLKAAPPSPPRATQRTSRCKDIYDTVEYFFRKDTDDASRHPKCARWGVQYASDPN